MTVEDMLSGLQALPIALAIGESDWLFPAFESAHVVAIALVVGSIMIVDLRLLGIASNRAPVSALVAEILPWTWGLFAIAVLSGLGLFISDATGYFANPAFRWKMVLLTLAGLNMVVFHLTAYRSVRQWDQGTPTRWSARVAGALSLILWVGVVAFGRWVGFVGG
jgi:hypothetical protein